MQSLINTYLPAATKLGQGNIFTSVCLSTGGRGVCLSACWDIPPRADTPPGADTPQSRPPSREQTPPAADPPRSSSPPGKQTPAYGQRAAGTHPTGMHSCLNFYFLSPGLLIQTALGHLIRHFSF